MRNERLIQRLIVLDGEVYRGRYGRNRLINIIVQSRILSNFEMLGTFC